MNEERDAFLPLVEQARRLRAGENSPVSLVEMYLARIARYDDAINAYITVCEQDALAAANTAESEIAAGRYRGPLHGIPFAVKDQMAINGVRVTAGSLVLRDWVPEYDATVIARLKSAGAILLGTLNTHEFHLGPTETFPYGTPRNPWNVERNPGGSSSGSASAVAAGLCAFALGGDTGGSVRAPAAFCGVVGLKPTWGRVSRHGVLPLAWSLDCVGILTRDVQDAAHVLRVVAGHDRLDPTTSSVPVPNYACELGDSLRGVRIGVVREMVAPEVVEPAAIDAVMRAIDTLKDLGASITEVGIPHFSDTRFLSPAVTKPEAAAYHEPHLRHRYHDYDFNTRVGLMVGAVLPAGLVSKAQRARTRLSHEIHEAFQEADVLVGAGSPGGAPLITARQPIRSKDAALNSLYGLGTSPGQLTRAWSFSGGPAMSVRCGFDADGLPLSLHLATSSFREVDLLRVANQYQRATPWQDRLPSLKPC